MLDQIAAAFDRQDYKTAASLLKQLQQQSPDSPWVTFYLGRLREATGKLEAAELLYRSLLQVTANPKVAAQARLGVQRLATLKAAAPSPPATESAAGAGVLVLEAIAPDYRQQAAQRFGQVMGIDAYSARMLLPSRGWRLYRVGDAAELQKISQQLRKAEIPAFWQPVRAIQALKVFRVRYIETASPQVKVICENEAGQTGGLSFGWAEVSDRVEGRLPIFEHVVDLNARNQLTRREATQDYAQVIDLHLPQRRCILRFGDWSYQFGQGVLLDAKQDGELVATQLSNRIRWNKLVYFLDEQLSAVPVWTEFPQFAETALELLPLIELKSQIDLLRKAPSQWDQAFQLYSGLVFQTRSAL